MALAARRLAVRPDPLGLARAVAGRPGAVLLWSGYGQGDCYVACDPIATASGLDPEPGLPFYVEAGPLGRAPRWVGLLPYEGQRSLERRGWTRWPDRREDPHLLEPTWYRYGAVAVIGRAVLVVGDDSASVRHLCSLLRAAEGSAGALRRGGGCFEAVSAPDEDEDHARRIRCALELIAAGQIYQVNLARRFSVSARGNAVELFSLLAGRVPTEFGAAFEAGSLSVVSQSPELFLDLAPDGRVWTAPIKGTRPRGRDAPTDLGLVRELEADPKEQAELTMVIDVERNDLGRVARPGSVRLVRPARVQTHPSVHHRVAVVGGRLRQGIGRRELLEAMLPSGSITGAPKIRAMEVIATLEPHRRGLYTGALGVLRYNGGLRLGMAIRTLTVRGGHGHYHAGGGIVADSDPHAEVEETRWKAARLLHLSTQQPSRRDATAAASQNLAPETVRR